MRLETTSQLATWECIEAPINSGGNEMNAQPKKPVSLADVLLVVITALFIFLAFWFYQPSSIIPFSTGAGPDLNCSFATNVTAIRFAPNFTSNISATLVYPTNQTSVNGSYQCTNNGSVNGTLQIELNDTYPNVIEVVSTDNFNTSNLTLNSSYQTLTLNMSPNQTVNIWFYRNYSDRTITVNKNVAFNITIS